MNRGPLIFGGSVLLAAMVLVFGFLLPRGREVSALRDGVGIERAELEQMEFRLRDLRAADPVDLKAEALAYRELIPAGSELPEFLALLEQLADQSGVSVSSVNVGVPGAAASSPVTSIGFTLAVSGDYFSLARFLFAIEHAPRLIRTTTISVVRGQGQGLSMSLSIQTFTTDPNAGPGSDPAVGPEVGT